jgi:hypothetical protein
MPTDPFTQQTFVTNGTTFVNPLGLGFTIACGVLMVLLPRKYALLPVVLLVCYMTMGMRIMIGELNFTMLRILLAFGILRVGLRQEFHSFRLNVVDKCVIAWVVSSIVTFALLWQTLAAFKNKLGFAYTALGFYFLFRCLVRGLEDMRRAVKFVAIFIVPLACLMGLEKFTGANPFSIFGGVQPLTLVRGGVRRCEGPFAHPILAGTFAATLLPFFIALWWQHTRLLAAIGIIAAFAIILFAASSGPVLACAAGLGALCLWPFRRKLYVLRWTAGLGLAGLALVMNAPVWFVIAKLDVFSGSTGWHRADLIHQAVTHLSDWWLVGTKTTENWEEGLFDVTNQYIVYGTEGGLITMLLFIVIIALCFRTVGKALRRTERERGNAAMFIWAMGAALFAHAINFMGVSYFDQNFVMWCMLLAMISTVHSKYLVAPRRSPVRECVDDPVPYSAFTSDSTASIHGN